MQTASVEVALLPLDRQPDEPTWPRWDIEVTQDARPRRFWIWNMAARDAEHACALVERMGDGLWYVRGLEQRREEEQRMTRPVS